MYATKQFFVVKRVKHLYESLIMFCMQQCRKSGINPPGKYLHNIKNSQAVII